MKNTTIFSNQINIFVRNGKVRKTYLSSSRRMKDFDTDYYINFKSQVANGANLKNNFNVLHRGKYDTLYFTQHRKVGSILIEYSYFVEVEEA